MTPSPGRTGTTRTRFVALAATPAILFTLLLLAPLAAGAVAVKDRPADLLARALPRMIYPTLDYGSRTGELVWHRWFRPTSWTDGDDVAVTHARWTSWDATHATASVRVVIAGERGSGRITLSSPGYCRAAGAFGFLKIRDWGGIWGEGITEDLTEKCRR